MKRLGSMLCVRARHGSRSKTTAMILACLTIFGAVRILAQVRRDFYSVRVVSGSFSNALEYYAANRAPATFDQWKKKYNFPSRMSGEALDAYRRRAGIAVYYNRNELGLGRELGCSRFIDSGPNGKAMTGVACFVTNYGQRFENPASALSDAIAGVNPADIDAYVYAPVSTRAPTVVPGLSPLSYSINFIVYDGSGKLVPYSNLDFTGRRAVPQICTNCHGGTYDPRDKLVIGGTFTPINPSILSFSTVAGYTFDAQAGRIAALNAITSLGATCPPGVDCPGH